MNQFKKSLSVLLVLTMMLCVFSAFGKTAAYAEDAAYYTLGDKIDDFTVTTYDGKEITLSKVLEEKEVVLLNLWATFCGPCAAEFPAMQEAYEQYQDKVEIIALSTDEADSDEILAAYAAEKGMTFPVTRDTVGLYDRIDTMSIPVTLVVDRFGILCAIEVGSAPDPAIFTRVFDLFTADDYEKSLLMPSIHAELPGVQPADPAELNAALNGEGGNLVFTNSENAYYWPMVVEEKDGRTVVSASNVDAMKSTAVVETQLEVNAGDVVVVEYKASSDYQMSTTRFSVDGKSVKTSSIDRDWSTYAYEFKESGTYRFAVSFERGITPNEGKEGLWIDSIRLVSGDEAAEALANNPQYPVAERITFQLLNENAEKVAIVLADTEELATTTYLCLDPVLRMAVTLAENVDPDTAILMDAHDNIYPLANYVTEDGYLVEIPNEFVNGSTYVALVCNMGMATIDIFDSMEAAQAYAVELGEYAGLDLKAMPWDESMVLADVEEEGDGIYTVYYVDQNGDPVPGVMCQVCDENTCQVFVSDANGICEFTLAPGQYEIHTLMVPAGYEGDTETVTDAPYNGGELTFTLKKQ